MANNDQAFLSAVDTQTHANTSAWTETEMVNNRPTPDIVAEIPEDEFPTGDELGHGDVLIAAITSCTNNPSVMLAAGLPPRKQWRTDRQSESEELARAREVVTAYLERTGLQNYPSWVSTWSAMAARRVIGNSGPLDPAIEQIVNDVTAPPFFQAIETSKHAYTRASKRIS